MPVPTMGRMFLRYWLLFAGGVAVGALAHAARPFMTDDARVTTTGSCQVEAWTRHAADRSESWLLPACNPNGHFEVTAGGGRFRTDGAPGASDHVIQGKTLLRALSPNDWGWGVAVGQVTHPGAQPGLNPSGSRYIYVPLSLSMRDDQVVVHMNLDARTAHPQGLGHLGGGCGVLGPPKGHADRGNFWRRSAKAMAADRLAADADPGPAAD